MNSIVLKVARTHHLAHIPKYAIKGDAGLDLIAVEIIKEEEYCIWYNTGLAVEIPEGYMGLVFPRSSISKMNLMLSNGVGVIDSGYRGDIQVRFNILETGRDVDYYSIGDKIAQLVIIPYPLVQINPVETLSDSRRGKGGFGSTG